MEELRFIGGDPNSPAANILYLHENKLTVGSGGIKIAAGSGMHIKSGSLTSTENNLKIEFHARHREVDVIDAAIVDDGYRSIGLEFRGVAKGANQGVRLVGGKSNTFTGKTIVDKVVVGLAKNLGATAISGDVAVSNGGTLQIYKSNQISDKSTITLSSTDRNSTSSIRFSSMYQSSITEKIGRLIVEKSGVIDFDYSHTGIHGKRYFYIDNLVINAGGILQINNWLDGIDYLLIHKDSAHLQDALKKINFTGYDRNAIHLEDYNNDYWSISATPEPSTYGAILGPLGLGLFIYQKRKKRTTSEEEKAARAT